jgi:hypothetical protein
MQDRAKKRAFEVTKKMRFNPWPALHRRLRPTPIAVLCFVEA